MILTDDEIKKAAEFAAEQMWPESGYVGWTEADAVFHRKFIEACFEKLRGGVELPEALERKLPGGKQTDDFESSRIGDYNQGWNDYRKAVKKMFKNINMNSSENSNPDAYLYSLEYGEKVVDTKVSIHQLNYPFGVAGADYLVRNDDGVSYVRQTKLYAALSRALAAGQKFIKENGK